MVNPANNASVSSAFFAYHVEKSKEIGVCTSIIDTNKAAQRANTEDIQKLEKILEKDLDNLRHNRNDAKTDADFHVTIALATHNTLFSHLMASCYQILWNTQKVSREKIFKNKGNRKLISEQHVKIFEAIRDRAADRAAKEARNHIDFVERELRKVLAEEGSTS